MATCQLSPMEFFIQAFLSLDKNGDELVSREELREYCRDNQLDDNTVEAWMTKFDADKDGYISLDEFTRGFGLKAEEMRIERTERTKVEATAPPILPEGVEIIVSSMSNTKQQEIVNKFVEMVDETNRTPGELSQVATKFKSYLDEKHGRVWQVILLSGSYWMNFSHEPFQNMQFKYGTHICLIWRTPT